MKKVRRSSYNFPVRQNKLKKTFSAIGLGIFASIGICSPVFLEGSQQLGSGD
jgi:hypothetical protein